jgi:hypothetical protein
MTTCTYVCRTPMTRVYMYVEHPGLLYICMSNPHDSCIYVCRTPMTRVYMYVEPHDTYIHESWGFYIQICTSPGCSTYIYTRVMGVLHTYKHESWVFYIHIYTSNGCSTYIYTTPMTRVYMYVEHP